MSNFRLENGQTILFIGDSITDCGCRDQFPPLGDGYVKLFSEIVAARLPQIKLNFINKGISGDTVGGLRGRWGRDVMRHEFDWLSVKIGINDVHRQLESPGASSVRQFGDDYNAVLAETIRSKRARIILIDPFYISTDRSGGFQTAVLNLLEDYLQVVETLAQRYDAAHVRTHAMFQNLLKHRNPEEFCPEPVHPYRSGHLAIALELYRVLGGTL